MKWMALVVIVAAAACGPKASSSSTTPRQGGDSAAVALPDLPYEKLDHDQRIEFMKQKVVPQMKPIFQRHDATAFAEFGCQTCHGEQAKDGHFDMPNPKLPKLNFKDMSKFKKDDLEWMGKEVEPAMAKILDMPVYSEANPKGFGCLACHTQEGE